MRWAAIGLTALCLASASRIAAQGPTLQGHPEDYPRADIEYGVVARAGDRAIDQLLIEGAAA
jgi:hypothetical protein